MGVADWWRGRGADRVQVRRWHGVTSGERPVAGAEAADGTSVVATRDALFLARAGAVARRLAWEEIQDARWDPESHTFRVSEVGTWGEVRPEHVVELHEATLLLEFVRDRVTSSIVLQHDVTVPGHGNIRVIARRAPSRDLPLRWVVEYDDEVDPSRDAVREAALAALARARDEVGGG